MHRLLLFAGVTIVLLLTVLQVIFLHPAPLHPHIYSNGHICLGMCVFFYSYCVLRYNIILWHTLLLQGFVMCYFLCLFVLVFMFVCIVFHDTGCSCNLLRVIISFKCRLRSHNFLLRTIGKRAAIGLFFLLV